MTNGDKIRAMSDEELARIIMCPNDAGIAEITCSKNESCDCYACCLNWLETRQRRNKS